MERQTLTVREVADYLGLHTDIIYAMVKEKQIPHLKIRRRILFTKQSIDLWIQDQEHTNPRI
ncbi:helix-turn-helix domain-containing protein [Virgibacillus necropolis]|uniref:DNA-binding protein n=1 Tax=Virgibacillus necropolis TaxID=163877 RepID=A0A221MDM5_9BACI|nr:helix-turn-helix domain-containing protein [Virgibacillus necropolis]ASN05788.1 DNA-binding protein [Virgibacillus necropolis]